MTGEEEALSGVDGQGVMGLSVGYLFSHWIILALIKLTTQWNNQAVNE